MSFRQEHKKLDVMEVQKQTETTIFFGWTPWHTASPDSWKHKIERREVTEAVISLDRVLFLLMCVQHTDGGGGAHAEAIAEHLPLLLSAL